MSTWYRSGGSLRFQIPARLPVVSNLNLGVHTEAVCSHHLLRCETSQKYLHRCGGSAGKWGDRPGMPSGSPSDSDCITPHPLPHTSRHPSSHAHSLRTVLSRSLSSTQSGAGRLPHWGVVGRGAAGVGQAEEGWSKEPWLWACNQKSGVKKAPSIQWNG